MASKDNSEIVRCNDCKTVLNEPPSLPRVQRVPCPVCGSLSRDHMRFVNSKLGVSTPEGRAKGKRHGRGKAFIDQYSRRELYRDTGEIRDVERIIDRTNNIYREVVRDSKTGKLIRLCCEPLDKHIEHGYAKCKGRKA